jgi:hypothetical protein
MSKNKYLLKQSLNHLRKILKEQDEEANLYIWFSVLSYYVSLRSEFRIVMSITIAS